MLFGSQTGNSQGLAKEFSRKLEERGFQATLSSMGDFKPTNLKNLRNLLVVVSTHGEGEPPDSALLFFEFLHSKRAPRLEDLRYSVLALGDSSYEFFCKTGKDFDRRLEELGGQRLFPRVDCDVDFDEPAAEWFEGVLGALSGTQEVPSVAAEANTALQKAQATEAVYSRTNPFYAEVLENLNLNGRGSNRETRHLEISLAGSNLQYEPGDCLGIYPQNPPELVDKLIGAMGWNPDEPVLVNKKGEECALREALLSHYEITVLTKPLMEQTAQLSSSVGLRELLEPGREQELRTYLNGRDLLDLVQDFSLRGLPAGEFVPILRKMPARLYSIASSSKANPDEVHVTIRTVRYHAHGRERYGVCSVYCADRVQPGDTLPVYVHHNPNFKLPSDPDTPVIMIGPGTGVAPFRAFLAEREEIGAKGKTWLFYGDQHFSTDFLYQLDWQKWLKEGVLTRMDVAFSRDTSEKVYVQHRMLEKSKDLFRWLEEGAHVYVCGDEKHMAHDVHAALATILEQEGGMSREEALAYLSDMQQQKRYQRDVY
ncbi:sulfite reductase [NADPH] flavoprotein alpha-component [Effusibacillus dendaii]|uniref:assimilatory sulfite reductase (NADPH) n=1 Tax=Effusibacillus dendaii TaxID=2743772 RepID=A0A7I8DHQ7_9BACL|nr:sulfite reductase [NADPH] flavoprotein alpha-component [Effusibacillus dendaii]